MKKMLGILLLAVLQLTGCSAADDPQVTQPPIEVEVEYEEQVRTLCYQGVELSLRSVWDQNDPQADILMEAAVLFEKQTGAVVHIIWPNEDAAEEPAAEADILQLSAAEFELMDKENILDLAEMAAAADYESQSHEVLRRQIITKCGYLGAIAQTPYLGAIYYRTDAFAQCGITEIPRDWGEFTAMCRILRENGWQPLTLDNEDTLTATELHLRSSIGVAELTRLMGKEGYWPADQAAVAALEQIMFFVINSNMAFLTPTEYPAGQNKVALSNCAMMIGTNVDCQDVENGTLIDLNWGVLPYPGSACSTAWMTADVLAIHQDCENPQAAFDFIMLLTTGEFDQLRADVSCGIPADPANTSPIEGVAEAIRAVQPEPMGLLNQKQLDTTVKLWSGWYQKASTYASVLERNK